MDSPIGALTLRFGADGLEAIEFGRRVPAGASPERRLADAALSQLDEYFAGKRRSFDIPLALAGTPFQLAVWRELIRIPYGETRSYGDVARALGKPGAARAVGMANHDNPIPVIVPCHRVVGANGSLTGYGGGLPIKAQLLALEGAPVHREPKATSRSARGRSTETATLLFP